MRRSLVRYNPSTKVSGTTILIGIALVGLIIWLIVRSKQPTAGQYLNKESWDISYNEDGLPTKITIHRDATRQ